MKSIASCAVIGYGRFGTLMSQILRESLQVDIVARSTASSDRAKADGYNVIPIADAGKAQMLILCVPISEFAGVINELKGNVGPDTLVIDTCSVKTYPADIMRQELPESCQILATHPLFGPDSAKNGLRGLRMAICPIRIDDDKLQTWVDTWEKYGIDVITTTPDEHDWAMAYTQGITHFVGRVLGDLDLGPNPLATKGYESMLEVSRQTSNDSWQLFLDLQSYNPYTKQMRQELYAAIDKVEMAINQSIDKPDTKA